MAHNVDNIEELRKLTGQDLKNICRDKIKLGDNRFKGFSKFLKAELFDFVARHLFDIPQLNEALSHESLSHESLSHESLSHESLSHESLSHKSLSHESLSHESLSHESLSHESLSHESL